MLLIVTRDVEDRFSKSFIIIDLRDHDLMFVLVTTLMRNLLKEILVSNIVNSTLLLIKV